MNDLRTHDEHPVLQPWADAPEEPREYCAFCDDFCDEMSGEEFPKRMQFGFVAGKAAYRTVMCEACAKCAAMMKEEL